MRRGLNATRSPSPRAPSRLSGPSPSPSSLLVASLAHSLSDSLSTDLEGKKKTYVLLVFGFSNRQRLCWLYFLCKSNKKISKTDLNHLSLLGSIHIKVSADTIDKLKNTNHKKKRITKDALWIKKNTLQKYNKKR